MALNATPKDPTANSYLTRDEATDILTTRRLYAAEWTAATDAKKDAALMWATRLIDQGFDWVGSVRVLEQGLRWPRAGMLDPDYRYVDPDTIPERLKEATADLALALLQRDRTGDPALIGLGFSRAQAGPVSVTVDANMVLDIIPRFIVDALQLWGSPIGPASGRSSMRTLPLGRV